MADETLRGVELAHRYADLGDVQLHYVEAGEGPLVLLLHGFPQFWYQWRHQIPALLEAGFRVVAPDMRGYNISDKPPGVAHRRDPGNYGAPIVPDHGGRPFSAGQYQALHIARQHLNAVCSHSERFVREVVAAHVGGHNPEAGLE